MPRLLICLLGSVLASFAMVACGQEDPAGSPAAKLRIGYLPIVECAHLYIGVNRQFFAEEGLEVELQPMRGGATILPAVQSGDLELGFTNVLTLLLLDSELSVTSPRRLLSVVGGTYERPGFSNHALLVKRDANVQVRDLTKPRTRIALNTTRNIEELMLRRFLHKSGLQPRALHIVEIPFPEMLGALEQGDVDVASVVEPFIEPAIKGGNFRQLARQYLEVSPNTVVATYAATKGWLEAHGDLADRFINAFRKSNDFLQRNEAEARQIIGTFTRIKPDDLAVIGLPAFEMAVSKESVQELATEGLRLHLLTSAPNLEGIIYAGGQR